MPKLTRALPRYSLHKQSGQARVSIAGRQHLLGLYDSPESRAKYDRLIAEWLKTGRPETLIPGGPVTVGQLVLAYSDRVEKLYRERSATGKLRGTALNYQPIFALLTEHWCDVPAHEITPMRLKELREVLVQQGLGRKTINEKVARIKKMFRWSASECFVTAELSNAIDAVESLLENETDAPEPDEVLPVSESDVEASLPYMPVVVADMVKVQRLSGARPGEIVRLTPRELSRVGDVWRYTPKRHKTQRQGKKRVIYFGPRAQVILAPYLEGRPIDKHCFSPKESEEKRRAEITARRKTPLSCGDRVGTNRVIERKNRAGDFYTADSYRRAIERACKKAKITPWAPHQLRHSAGTAIREEFGVEAAQVMLGHSRLNTTEIYAERNELLAITIAKAAG